MPQRRSIPSFLPDSRPTEPRAGVSSAAAPRPPRRWPSARRSLPHAVRDSGAVRRRTTTEDGGPASGTLRISNWPLYMADGFVAAFQTASGLTVDYKEDFNDNEEWFAKIKEPLSRKQDIGADLAVPTQFMAARLHNLGWLNEISDAGVPNKKNLRPDLLEASVDPDRKFTAPYMSGLVGLAYNRAATGRDITRDRRPVGSRVQGQGQPVLRRPGRRSA